MRPVIALGALLVLALAGTTLATYNDGYLCEDTCKTARNGRCEDGGQRILSPEDALLNAENLCEYGTDCSDCGRRGEFPPLSTPVAVAPGDTPFLHACSHLRPPPPRPLSAHRPRTPLLSLSPAHRSR